LSQTAPARRPSAGVPHTSLDPFSLEFLRDPHPAHEALREAGPVVWLEKYSAYAAVRLSRKARFDAVADCAEVYPMMVMPEAIGLSNQGPRAPVALCGGGVQHARPR
jgi:cytochrome P450